MVGDPVLGKVVVQDLLCTLAGADLRAARCVELLALPFELAARRGARAARAYALSLFWSLDFSSSSKRRLPSAGA